MSYLALSSKISDYKTAKLFMDRIKEEGVQLSGSFLLFEVEQGDTLERLYRSWGAGMLHYNHIMPVFDTTQERILARVMVYPKINSIDKEKYLKCLQSFLFYEYFEGISSTLCSEESLRYKDYISEIYEDLKTTIPDVVNII